MNRILPLIISCVALQFAFTAEAEKPKAKDATDGALKGFKVAKDFQVSLWTSDKQIMNPTAIAFDDQNRLHVAETFRFRDGGGIDIGQANPCIATTFN